MSNSDEDFMTLDFFGNTLTDMFARCDAIKAAGGIGHREVMEQGTPIPDGWVYDVMTGYYHSPHLFLERTAVQ